MVRVINSGDVEALAAAVFGTPDRLRPDAARAAQPADQVMIAGGVYNVALLPNVNEGLMRHLPLLNPANNGVEFIANGTVEIVNMIDGAPNPIGQALIGAYRRRVRWTGDFVLDETRATPRRGAGLFTAFDTDVCDAEYSYRGMAPTDPRQWGDNHPSCFAEYVRNLRLAIRTTGVRGAPGHEANAASVMLYGCQDVELYELLSEDGNAGIYVKGTHETNGRRYNNMRVRIVRPTFRRLTNAAITWMSAWGGSVDGGVAEDCALGLRFSHPIAPVVTADDYPQDISVDGFQFRNCARDVFFKANTHGHYRNISLRVAPGTRVEFEGNDNDGYATVVPTDAAPAPAPSEAPTPAPTPEPAPLPASYTHRELDDALERALSLLGVNAQLSGGQFTVARDGDEAVITMSPIRVRLG